MSDAETSNDSGCLGCFVFLFIIGLILLFVFPPLGLVFLVLLIVFSLIMYGFNLGQKGDNNE